MTRSASLHLYKSLMKEAGKFPDFNFRNYFQRRIRDEFKNAKDVTNTKAVEKGLARGRIELEMLRRQATIGHLFDPHIQLPLK